MSSALSSQFIILALSYLLAHPVSAYYTPNPERGLFANKFNSPSGTVEECIIAKRLPNWTMSDKDIDRAIKSEAELCEINFYSKSNLPVGICPKLNSTNPGILIYDLGSIDKENFENTQCANPSAETKVIAKFKQSVSCSYTPSIIGYYHLSQILNTMNVPAAVIRTMEMTKHKELRNQALEIIKLNGRSDSIIFQTWSGSWGQAYSSPPGKYADRVMTADLKQIFGALSKNPRGEEKYNEIYGRRPSYEKRFETMMAQPPAKRVMDSRDLKEIVTHEISEENLQVLVQMSDVSDMLVFDYILGQHDRPGNIHYKNMLYYSKEGSDWQKIKTKDAETSAEYAAAKYKFKIKDMILKDNDCGIIKGNDTKNLGLIKNISHISPKTYQNVLRLTEAWTAHPDVTRQHVQREWLFTDQDYENVTKDLLSLRDLLVQRCVSGKLKQDLDIASHFTNSTPLTSCELQ
ncbi:MAG: hypothetical protein KDD38_05070 [Bdellovibrionales bacterium]|nr:hypothetical protein [Bdellovibrionales bacterium]